MPNLSSLIMYELTTDLISRQYRTWNKPNRINTFSRLREDHKKSVTTTVIRLTSADQSGGMY